MSFVEETLQHPFGESLFQEMHFIYWNVLDDIESLLKIMQWRETLNSLSVIFFLGEVMSAKKKKM